MVIPIVRRSILSLLIVVMLFLGSTTLNAALVRAATSYSIELKEFRWNRFPLKVLVDMNQWSKNEYAVAVHEAIDDWMKGIWNYTHLFTNTTLMITYLFYVSNVNFTSNSDITVSFVQDVISREPEAIGITTYTWDFKTNTPNPPIVIRINTYSATADFLFVKNVAMHEFGHAIGLGHASSPDTINGPELMFSTLSVKQVVYPSTLDIYGLTMLYKGYFSRTVRLPSGIPYRMLAEAPIPLYQSQPLLYFLYPSVDRLQYVLTKPLEIFYQPIILLVPSTIWMVIATVFGLVFHSRKGGILVSITLSYIIAYCISIFYDDFNLVSLGLKIITLLPAIVMGASVGGLIGKRLNRKRETLEEKTIESLNIGSP